MNDSFFKQCPNCEHRFPFPALTLIPEGGDVHMITVCPKCAAHLPTPPPPPSPTYVYEIIDASGPDDRTYTLTVVSTLIDALAWLDAIETSVAPGSRHERTVEVYERLLGSRGKGQGRLVHRRTWAAGDSVWTLTSCYTPPVNPVTPEQAS